MDTAGSQIGEIVAAYRQQLEKMGVRVERAILFGSHASGKATEDSDVDLLIVSSDFEQRNTRERLELLGVAAARIWQPIEALACTPEELGHVEPASFLEEILATGVPV